MGQETSGPPFLATTGAGDLAIMWPTNSKLYAAIVGELDGVPGATSIVLDDSFGGISDAAAAPVPAGYAIAFYGHEGGTTEDVRLLHVGKDWQALSEDTTVNSYTSGAQSMPKISCFPDGGCIVVWHSDDQDGDGYGSFAQRFNLDGTKKYK